MKRKQTWFWMLGILYSLCMPAMMAQHEHTFGQCSDEELALQRYDKDTLAEALVIYDQGTVAFMPEGGGFRRIFERIQKIKIFTKAGFKWSEISIPGYTKGGAYEKVTEIEGATYHLGSGVRRKTILDPKHIYEEQLDKGWILKKFAMPDVQEGSVIELRYVTESSQIVNLPTWEFQQKIPVLYSSYTVKTIPYYTYVHWLQGATHFDAYQTYETSDLPKVYGKESYQEKVEIYTIEHLPAFRDESYLSSYEDYVIKVDFQLAEIRRLDGGTEQVMKTWPALVQNMLDHKDFGGYLKEAKSLAKTLTATWQPHTDLQKVALADQYLKQNYSWNGLSAKLADQSPKDFVKTKIGNVACINLFYVALLRAMDIQADPVLISTRGHGKVHQVYPFAQVFNDLIVRAKIDTVSWTLDATDPVCLLGELPVRCLNDVGLVVKKQKNTVSWWYFAPLASATQSYDMELFIDAAADSIHGDFKVAATGYDALNWRKEGLDNSKEGLLKDLPVAHLTIKESNPPKKMQKAGQGYEISFHASEAATWIGGRLILSPFCHMVMSDQPFKAIQRNYPIDLIYQRQKYYHALIHIPKYLKSDGIPTSLAPVETDDLSIRYEVIQRDEYTLEFSASYQLKKDIYPPAAYKDLQQAFETIINKFNESLVLVRR